MTTLTVNMRILVLFVLVQVYISISWVQGSDTPVGPCSSSCACISSEHTLIVNCSKSQLHTLPDDLPPSVTLLLLSNNQIEDIGSCTLPKLKRLFLDHNKLSEISKDSQSLLRNVESLELAFNAFTYVPDHLPTGLKFLRLSHNTISEISLQSFANMTHLQELFVDNNNLTSLNKFIFGTDIKPYLPELQKMDLSENRISVIEGGVFKGMPYVAALSLMNNNLSVLYKDTFLGMKNLQYLDISQNRLQFIEQGTFKNLKVLKSLHLHHNLLRSVPQELPMIDWLDLSYNNLTRISEECRVDVYPPEILLISHNPLHCDCDMLWMKEFYDRREHVYQYTNMKPSEYLPMCATPEELSGETWDLLGDDMFICTYEAETYSQQNVQIYDVDASAIESSQKTSNNLKTYLRVRVEDITRNTITISWTKVGEGLSGTVSIQYYIFGHRHFVKTISNLNSARGAQTLEDLTPDTNYIVCILPDAAEGAVSDVNLDSCVEAKTANPDSILAYYKLLSKSIFGRCFMGAPVLFIVIVIVMHMVKNLKAAKTNMNRKLSNKKCRKEHDD